MTVPSAPEVIHEPAQHRFVISVDHETAGLIEYLVVADGDAFDFVHTEIDERFGGQGLGGILVSAALQQTRDLGVRVIAHCPFVVAWLHKHPEFDTGSTVR